MHTSDSDDEPTLSLATLTALQEFYTEEQERQVQLQKIISSSHEDNVPDITENWQLSQFWYDQKTSEMLASEAVRASGKEGKIALISCPTLYKQIRNISKETKVTLFEFDERFAIFGEDFCFYDYRCPLKIPPEMSGNFDIVVADPPFLSEECLAKTAITIKFLAKEKIILCTGAVMTDLAERLLQLKKTTFEPKHNNNLCNEFKCFANYVTELY